MMVDGDFDWIRRHEKELLAQYGECSIIVYKEQVIGVGPTYAAALENAEQNLPPEVREVTPVHQWLRYRHPFWWVRLTPSSNGK
ncbi:MAG: hypothetical protein IT324_19170 [Anaerolineae bacterium]|nr:hypothetical protein [Anaerolineae bacterium]